MSGARGVRRERRAGCAARGAPPLRPHLALPPSRREGWARGMECAARGARGGPGGVARETADCAGPGSGARGVARRGGPGCAGTRDGPGVLREGRPRSAPTSRYPSLGARGGPGVWREGRAGCAGPGVQREGRAECAARGAPRRRAGRLERRPDVQRPGVGRRERRPGPGCGSKGQTRGSAREAGRMCGAPPLPLRRGASGPGVPPPSLLLLLTATLVAT